MGSHAAWCRVRSLLATAEAAGSPAAPQGACMAAVHHVPARAWACMRPATGPRGRQRRNPLALGHMANHPGVADVPNVMIAAFDAAVPQGGAGAPRSPSALPPLQGCAASPHGQPVDAVHAAHADAHSRMPAPLPHARSGPPARARRPARAAAAALPADAALCGGAGGAPVRLPGRAAGAAARQLARRERRAARERDAGACEVGRRRRHGRRSARPAWLCCALCPGLRGPVARFWGLLHGRGLSPMSLPRDPALASPPCQVRHPCKLECRCSMAAV